ncbi:hypothetical protein BEN35_09940 [Streptomyces fradiae]|nr:hypothetical protein BEN35_09940 [Streptomyces fradiae]
MDRFHFSTPLRVKWRTPRRAQTALAAGSSPSSRSQTCTVPRCRMRTAASRVLVTISIGSLPGTNEVRKATRVPGSGVTGTGSRATSVAWAFEKTVHSRKNSMRPIETSIVVSAADSQPETYGRCTQCAGWSSQNSSSAEKRGAAQSSRVARIRCGSCASRLRYATRYGFSSSTGSWSGPASLLYRS